MSPADLVRLKHIADAIDTALRFVEGKERGDLEPDGILTFALVRAVEVVGEAASKVSSEGRSELTTVPWGSVVGMRNRLVHAYFDVDLEILWNTVTVALPELRAQIGAAL